MKEKPKKLRSTITFTDVGDLKNLPNMPEVLMSKIQENEGIVTSVEDFIKLLVKANEIYNDTFKISDDRQLIFADNIPREMLQKLNNNSSNTNINKDTLNDIRIVTYRASEEIGTISQHKINSNTGVKSIKYRTLREFPDPDYTGYNKVILGKEIDAVISFTVWGLDYYDIRQRSRQLREMIDSNIWFLKKKGLKDIYWLGSNEHNVSGRNTLLDSKIEEYFISFTEIKEIREKCLDQISSNFSIHS